jgi:hypothetical protein
MRKQLSRRAMVASLAAVAPAGAVAAMPAIGADAELLKLEKEFDAAVVTFEKMSAKEERAQDDEAVSDEALEACVVARERAENKAAGITDEILKTPCPMCAQNAFFENVILS